jgi:ABC-2 type transport system permease protein
MSMMARLVRKEIREQVLSLKGVIWMALAAVMFSGLSYSFITVKELSILAQIEIINTFLKVVIGYGLLITIISAAASIAGEKEQGTLESLLLLPLMKRNLVIGKWLGAMAIWLVIAIIAFPYLLALGNGTSLYGALFLFLFGFGTLTVGSFAAVALALSSLLQSSKNAIIVSVALFLVTALPDFLGTTIKKSGFGKVIDTISPLSGTMKLMKDLLINKLSIGHAVLNSVSMIWFAIAAILFLAYAVKKLTLLGGE